MSAFLVVSFDKNMWNVLAASDVAKKEYADITNWFFCITLISTEYNNIIESDLIMTNLK